MCIYREFKLHWRGRELLIRYCPDYSSAFNKTMGAPLAHLTIQANDERPLPITETGFLSQFIMGGIEIDDQQTICEQITAHLDIQAKEKSWQEYLRDSQQLSLF